MSTEAASGSCSDWLIRSAATQSARAVPSAITAISLGPASASTPITPCRARFAAATYTLPGPVTRSTGAQSHPPSSSWTPCASMATAWAPPAA